MGKVTITSIIVNKFYNLLGHTLRLTFTLTAPKRLPANRTVGGTDLLIFSGYRGAKMMKAMLLSIYYSWDNIPRVTIVSDGTPKEVLETAMQFWPYPYQIRHWEECAEWHRAKDHPAIIDFAHVNLFARKLLSILAEAEQRPVIYSDTDVLWYTEPRLPAPSPDRCTMRISLDNMHCYHLPAIRYLNRQDMLEKPPMNAGLVYLAGSVYDHYPDFEELLRFMRIFNEGPAEQLTFAMMADRLGDTWTPEEIILSTKDVYWPLLPRYPFSGTQMARHHVATKHNWFWRDALIILWRKNKTRHRAAHPKGAPIT
jgi:hypothetical protein